MCWFGWAYPFIFRAPHRQNRPSVTVSGPTLAGLLLECAGIFIAFAFRLETNHPPGLLRIVPSMIFGPISAILAWTSVAHLGRQFRIQAGLYADHELVQTGPYAVVRHPIYAALLAILLCTIFLLTPWQWGTVSLVLFLAGTEIRVYTEDKLLAARFGPEFEAYRQRVPAYLPFVR